MRAAAASTAADPGSAVALGWATLRGLYPRWEDFAALLREYDPAGKFRNEFTGRYFPAGA